MRFTHHTQVQQGLSVFLCYVNTTLPQYASHIKRFYLTHDPVPGGTFQGNTSYFVDGDADSISFNVKEHRIDYDVSNNSWVPNIAFIPSRTFHRTISLKDAGIGQNPVYNERAMFDDFDEAKSYIEYMMGLFSVSSTSPGTTAPVIDISTSDDDYDRAMRGL